MNKTLAKIFDDKASVFLKGLGFKLVNDPMETHSWFKLSQARYSLDRGLFLSALFNPNEGDSAIISFGRLWTAGGRALSISNTLSALAGRYGVELPGYYRFSSYRNATDLIDTMLSDLESALPTVLSRVTLADLEAVEMEMTGAQQIARTKLGSGWYFEVEISEFIPEIYTESK